MLNLFKNVGNKKDKFFVEESNFIKESDKQFLAQNGMDLSCGEDSEQPIRFKENAELSIPDAFIFYTPCIKGYTDYPFLEKALAM